MSDFTAKERRHIERICGGNALLVSLAITSVSLRRFAAKEPLAGVVPGRSSEDFFLRHGLLFRPRPLPARYRSWKGELGDCQSNALSLAVAHPELDYAEGYGMLGKVIPDHHVAHAWCVDVNGCAFDPTWTEWLPGTEYCGLALDRSVVIEAFRSGGRFGLLFNDILFAEVLCGRRRGWRRMLSTRHECCRPARRMPS